MEWKQKVSAGEPPRISHFLQTRVCFTELSPKELPGHSLRFGRFSLEFEIDTVRRLGAMPVFYVPRATSETADGSHVGSALVALSTDSLTVIERINALSELVNRSAPEVEKIELDLGFALSPENRRCFQIDRAAARAVLEALGHGVTPWKDLKTGLEALQNLFHPTDNEAADRDLEYYRQREWRIAYNLSFSADGGKSISALLRQLRSDERERLLEVDREFFSRTVRNGLTESNMLDEILVLPGLGPDTVIKMARRVIVPAAAVKDTIKLLSVLDSPPGVFAAEEAAESL